jgi:hypothetical protein
MSQISFSDTCDLLKKLLDERVPLVAFLRSPSGPEARLPGFIDSLTRDNGLAISASGPPIDPNCGFIRVFPFDEKCSFWYGEKRGLAEPFQHLSERYGESVLIMGFPGTSQTFALFFTL